jgi:chromate reductase, NAD(P)H dehydrogenase (quinone)
MPPPPLNIAAFAGSLRANSYNRGLLRAASELAPADVVIEILDLAAVPLFNQDLERSGVPSTVANLRERVRDADGLLIATPEYNHTIPGVLGHTIDWLSRRTPTSPLRDKPIAILGAARGGGSVRAALRVPLAHARAAVLDGPVVALYNIDELAIETGDLVDPEARQGVTGDGLAGRCVLVARRRVCRGVLGLRHRLVELCRADRGCGVRHQRTRGSAVPVPLVGRDPHRVAGAHPLWGLAFLADEPVARRDLAQLPVLSAGR